MVYGKYMNDLTEICTQVWSTGDLKAKQDLLKRAVATFKYKNKSEQILQDIMMMDADRLDQFASNLILNKTDKVVGMLKR